MITENNKIIAEFMGAKETVNVQIMYPIYEGKSEFTKKLKYHSDWNWLMEVVEKIEGLGYWTCLTGSLFEIGVIGSSQAIIFHAGSLKGETKIQAVYNACLEFIKWYNEQKSA